MIITKDINQISCSNTCQRLIAALWQGMIDSGGLDPSLTQSLAVLIKHHLFKETSSLSKYIGHFLRCSKLLPLCPHHYISKGRGTGVIFSNITKFLNKQPWHHFTCQCGTLVFPHCSPEFWQVVNNFNFPLRGWRSIEYYWGWKGKYYALRPILCGANIYCNAKL